VAGTKTAARAEKAAARNTLRIRIKSILVCQKLPAIARPHDRNLSTVRISISVQLVFLPLLHTLVEERAGERRLPSPYPSPRLRGGEGTCFGKSSVVVQILRCALSTRAQISFWTIPRQGRRAAASGRRNAPTPGVWIFSSAAKGNPKGIAGLQPRVGPIPRGPTLGQRPARMENPVRVQSARRDQRLRRLNPFRVRWNWGEDPG